MNFQKKNKSNEAKTTFEQKLGEAAKLIKEANELLTEVDLEVDFEFKIKAKLPVVSLEVL